MAVWTLEEFLGPVIGFGGRSIPTNGSLSRASSVPFGSNKAFLGSLALESYESARRFYERYLSSGALPSVRTIRRPKDRWYECGLGFLSLESLFYLLSPCTTDTDTIASEAVVAHDS
jgi:hypothetical protein